MIGEIRNRIGVKIFLRSESDCARAVWKRAYLLGVRNRICRPQLRNLGLSEGDTAMNDGSS